jgi:hypothetical protein
VIAIRDGCDSHHHNMNLRFDAIVVNKGGYIIVLKKFIILKILKSRSRSLHTLRGITDFKKK